MDYNERDSGSRVQFLLFFLSEIYSVNVGLGTDHLHAVEWEREVWSRGNLCLRTPAVQSAERPRGFAALQCRPLVNRERFFSVTGGIAPYWDFIKI